MLCGLGIGIACIPRVVAAGVGEVGERVLVEVRSPYNRIRVTEAGGVRTMYFVGDDGRAYIETRVDRAYPQSLDLDVFRGMMAGFLVVPNVTRVLIIGLGGGAIGNYLHRRLPELEIDAIDIDPEVVRIAQTYFGVPTDDPRFRCHVGDGRVFLERGRPGHRWDLILHDAYRGVTMPFHLKTAEFHQALRARLTPGGAVVANLHSAVPIYPRDRATFAAVYPRQYGFRSEGRGQTTLVATVAATPISAYEIRRNAIARQASFDFDLLGLAARYYMRRDWPAPVSVLHDDFPPGALDEAAARHNQSCEEGACDYR